MATLKIIGFSGEIPKLLPRVLPDMSAQAAFNVRLDDGGLTPVRRRARVHTFPDNSGLNYQTIYHHIDEWLGWDTVVNAAPGPVAADRLYYTGDGAPKMLADSVVYDLAVPRPTAALSGVASGTGTGPVQTRLYVYTFVTDFGEESEPSPISGEIDWQIGQDVTLSGFQAAPAGRNITKQRIYRSQTGLSGGTGLFFIAERAAATTDFVDDLAPSAIQEPLPSTLWNAPPDDLEGLIALPNGMMAAYVGKDLYFCEPYRPHAWPENYVLTFDFEIMGLGAFGTSLVVTTKGNPYIVSGTAPENMVSERLELNLPCINKRSVQDLGYGVAYASHDGLVVVSPGGARVATEQIISREAWLTLTPQTFVTGQFNGRYYAGYDYTDAEGQKQAGIIILDMSGQMPFVIRSNYRPRSMFYDIEQSALYFLRDNSVFEIDSRFQPNEQMTWKSKLFVLPRPVNFGAILIESDNALTPDEVAAIEAAIQEVKDENAAKAAAGNLLGAIGAAPINTYTINGDDIVLPPSFSQSASIAIYADRKLVAVCNTLNEMRRLPSGFLARQWEVEAAGDVRISQITLATTGAELMGV